MHSDGELRRLVACSTDGAAVAHGVRSRDLGKIKLYCKGADNVIFERLAPQQLFKEETEAHLQQLALEGLRTLCFAMAQIEPAAYEAWNEQFKAASTTLVNRAAEVRAAQPSYRTLRARARRSFLPSVPLEQLLIGCRRWTVSPT